MATAIGSILIKDAAVGSSAAAAIALGGYTVWQKEEPAPVTGPWLCFTATEANSSVQLTKSGSPAAVSLETSTNGTSWTDYSVNDTISLTNIGDKVYFRAKNENSTFSTNDSRYYKFTGTGKYAASGNIQSLLKADCSRTDAPNYCYYNLFQANTCITNASELELSATTIGYATYQGTFTRCTSLTAAPHELPATNLSAGNCYVGMFSEDTSLLTAPSLPATTLGNDCYSWMFNQCAFTDAPDLPATTLASSCYNRMFNNCSHLSSVNVAFTAWSPSNATTNWLDGTAASGTFHCLSALGTDSTISRGSGKCPTGWTVVNTDVKPWLCFTATEADSSVRLDKNGSPNAVSLETSTDGTSWTDYTWSGTTGTSLPLTNIGDKVYFRAKNENSTFSTGDRNCYKFTGTGKYAASGNIQSLLKADCSRTDAPAYCYVNMFQGNTSLTKAPELPAITIGNRCYNNLFLNCSSMTDGPSELPATTGATYCYSGMFLGCSALSSSIKIGLSSLVANQYYLNAAFEGCSSLSSVEVAFTSWANNASFNWLKSVASTGTFYCPSALGINETITRGASNCPTGWTVENTDA